MGPSITASKQAYVPPTPGRAARVGQAEIPKGASAAHVDGFERWGLDSSFTVSSRGFYVPPTTQTPGGFNSLGNAPALVKSAIQNPPNPRPQTPKPLNPLTP